MQYDKPLLLIIEYKFDNVVVFFKVTFLRIVISSIGGVVFEVLNCTAKLICDQHGH